MWGQPNLPPLNALVNITLGHTHISGVHLESVHTLRKINITFTKLASLPILNVNGSTLLEEAYLHDNQMTTLNGSYLQGMTELFYFDISNNQISGDVYFPVLPALTTFELMPNVFHTLTFTESNTPFEEFIINGIPLNTLPNVNELSHAFRLIDLKDNVISSFNGTGLENLPNLTTFIINKNRLTGDIFFPSLPS